MVSHDLSSLYFNTCAQVELSGISCHVTRCGYTGEDGFEVRWISLGCWSVSNRLFQLSVETKDVVALSELLLSKEGVEPAGLGARDCLRLEVMTV